MTLHKCTSRAQSTGSSLRSSPQTSIKLQQEWVHFSATGPHGYRTDLIRVVDGQLEGDYPTMPPCPMILTPLMPSWSNSPAMSSAIVLVV